jgi:NitT/TauT family transport system substrate-binding protein
MKTITRRTFILGTMALGGAVCSSPFGRPASLLADTGKVNLNVGYMQTTDHLLLPVSHALDGERYKHVRITPHLCNSWDEILGKIDMGILQAAFMMAPLALFNFLQHPTMNCVLLGHRHGSVIVTDKSITVANDLAGKIIGIPHAKSTHTILLYKYLQDNGVENINDIKLVQVTPALSVQNLKSGKINGYAEGEPWGIRGVDEGVARVLEYSKNIIPDHACCILMVNKRVIAKQRDAIEEWIESLARAGETIHQDPERAARIQTAYMQHPPELVLKVLASGMISYNSLTADHKTIATMHDYAFDYGILPERVDLGQFIDTRFV